MDHYIVMGIPGVKVLENWKGKTCKKTLLSKQIVHKLVTMQIFDKIITNIFMCYNFTTFCLTSIYTIKFSGME